MSEVKKFDPLVVGSTLTGVGLGPMTYSDILACASWLYGDELFTHEIVHAEIKSAYRAEGYRQFPDMPNRDDSEDADWKAIAADVRKRYGATVSVMRGSTQRTKGPVETLRDIRPDADVTIIAVDGAPQ